MYVELLQMGGYYVVLCLLLCVAVLLLIIFQDSFSSLPISHMWKKYLFCMCTMGKKCLSTASVCVCVCVCVCVLAPQDGSQVQWLLEVLNGGLRCTEDYRLYQRKRVLPHLMTLYTGPAINSKAKVSLAGYFQTESFFSLWTVCCVCVCAGPNFAIGTESMPIPSCCFRFSVDHGLLPWLNHISR